MSAARETEKNLGQYAEAKYYPIAILISIRGITLKGRLATSLSFLKNICNMSFGCNGDKGLDV
jgi:hypothetical protein